MMEALPKATTLVNRAVTILGTTWASRMAEKQTLLSLWMQSILYPTLAEWT